MNSELTCVTLSNHVGAQMAMLIDLVVVGDPLEAYKYSALRAQRSGGRELSPSPTTVAPG